MCALERPLRLVAFVSVWLVTLYGCAPGPGPLPPMASTDLLAELARTPGAGRIQASGLIQLNSPENNYNAGVLLFYREPDSVKMVIQAGFGTTLAEMLITGAEGLAYFPQQRQAFTLNAGSAIGIGSVNVYPSIVTSLLRPFTPAISEAVDSVGVVAQDGFYYLTHYAQGGTRVWKIDGRHRQLDTEEYATAEENIRWQRSFRVERRQLVPENIIVRFGGSTTTLFLRRIDVAPTWERSPFNIRLPEGVEVFDYSH